MGNVHKDFHGALSFGIQYLVDRYGIAGLTKYLHGLAGTVYAPLVQAMRTDGLPALRAHWDGVFSAEGGTYSMREEDETLVLEVLECPAIAHMKARGYAISPYFCEHTRILNEAICNKAGYACSVEYNQDEGRCVQRFWKAEA